MADTAHFFDKKIYVRRYHSQSILHKDSILIYINEPGYYDIAFFPTPDTKSTLPKNFSVNVTHTPHFTQIFKFTMPPMRVSISKEGKNEYRYLDNKS